MAVGKGDCALLTAAASKKGQAVEVELCGRTVAVFVDDDLGAILYPRVQDLRSGFRV